jgi:hypothetical protein
MANVSLMRGGSVSKIVGAQWYLHEVLQLQGHNRVLLIVPTCYEVQCSTVHNTSPNNTSPTFVVEQKPRRRRRGFSSVCSTAADVMSGAFVTPAHIYRPVEPAGGSASRRS